jgi:predicted pyridoxine 5'-phosphate oxidase superfamily flavin-nucleotide-binding protein
MGGAFSSVAFTPDVRAEQTRHGSRAAYARLDDAPQDFGGFGPAEVQFIESMDGFYQATVSQTGWPYVQFRGGPAGFLQVIDGRTIAYADLRGNRQYISVGNLKGNDRVALILMDHARRRRLKVMGQVKLVELGNDPVLDERFGKRTANTAVERICVIDVAGFDWNCPQHITPRYTKEQVDQVVAPLRQEIEFLREQLRLKADLRSGDK